MPRPTAGSGKISVLIPAYNEELFIEKVLTQVRHCFEVIQFSNFEIVVCDNLSTDKTAALATGAGAIVVSEPHQQIARARNSAAKAATGEWFIFLDADTLVSPELIKATVQAFQSGKICGGGSALIFDRSNLGLFTRGITGCWNWVSKTFRLAAGSYIFCSQSAWSDIGGFDETLYASEEIDFSRAVKRWGKTRGLKFEVFTKHPVVTSARKLDWYSEWQLLGHILRLLHPKAKRRKESCDLWYTRPSNSTTNHKAP